MWTSLPWIVCRARSCTAKKVNGTKSHTKILAASRGRDYQKNRTGVTDRSHGVGRFSPGMDGTRRSVLLRVQGELVV